MKVTPAAVASPCITSTDILEFTMPRVMAAAEAVPSSLVTVSLYVTFGSEVTVLLPILYTYCTSAEAPASMVCFSFSMESLPPISLSTREVMVMGDSPALDMR